MLSGCVFSACQGSPSSQYRRVFLGVLQESCTERPVGSMMIAAHLGSRRPTETRHRGKLPLFGWLPIVDAFRTFAVCPPPALSAVFQQIQTLACGCVRDHRTPRSTPRQWKGFLARSERTAPTRQPFSGRHKPVPDRVLHQICRSAQAKHPQDV